MFKLDTLYFQELSGHNPVDVCKRAQCTYDDAKRAYTIPVWDHVYTIYPHSSKIEQHPRTAQRLHPYFDLFMVHYLLKAKEIDPADEWISEKDIPGGSTFFRGPHAIPAYLISHRFKDNRHGFENKCLEFKGVPANLADSAFIFKITPRIPVAVLYWQGDPEFPAESKILYDKTIALHLASDVIYALAVGICERMMA